MSAAIEEALGTSRFRRQSGGQKVSGYDADLTVDQVRRQCRQPVVLAISRAILDWNGQPIAEARLDQALSKGCRPCWLWQRALMEKPDDLARLLSVCGKRPHRHPAKSGEQVASLHVPLPFFRDRLSLA
jgi:hypothetical protein